MEAAKATRVLLGCFRTGEASDPEVYTLAVEATLAQYPEHIIRQVADPRTGLPASAKFLPTVSEIRAACETLEGQEARAIERQQNIRDQIARRREQEELYRNQPKVDLAAGYPPNWGLHPEGHDKEDRSARLDPEFVKRKLGATDEQWQSIPDRR